MKPIHEELLEISDSLEKLKKRFDDPEIASPLELIISTAESVGKAWSGSWLGYQANVYYENLQSPPPGDHFSQEWGFMHTTDGWKEYTEEEIRNDIYNKAESPILTNSQELAREAKETFEDKKQEVLSILSIINEEQSDQFLNSVADNIKGLRIISVSEIVRAIAPSGKIMSRDSLAISQGLHTPPHLVVKAEIVSIKQPMDFCLKLSDFARRAGSHAARLEQNMKRLEIIGTNVFIGHGRSPVWREFKDFIQDRISLPWDEFNRVPVAGITNIARLSEMLDAAAIAFLIMTAEDVQADGRMQARMNVIHEAGLFQGRLGFTKAILLVEEGCDEFSNIEGLGQIRFPKGNIKAAFDEVRKVLEREGLIESGK
ncbi:MAG: nucleotide-binding protein [Candidatus Dadabacteria bacterium]|nr:nucleotide-binding protein [Candidatus Dadabacteria bacterium]